MVKEESVGLTNDEMKKSYIGALKDTFTSGKNNYFVLEHISLPREIKRMGWKMAQQLRMKFGVNKDHLMAEVV